MTSIVAQLLALSTLAATPTLGLAALALAALVLRLLAAGAGAGHGGSAAQAVFGLVVALSRARNLLCFSCDRCRRRYQSASSCQIPHVASLHDVLNFALGYRETGLFVEVGAYDGESFSNTSGLADLGWRGHYLEPIPKYARACAARHTGNVRVKVHLACAGERDGEAVRLSTAGPFTSAVPDEVASVAASKMNATLQAMGWSHEAEAVAPAARAGSGAAARRRKSSAGTGAGAAAVPAPAKKVVVQSAAADDAHFVDATTMSLNTFMKREHIGDGGAIDLLVVDVEGLELPILRGFDLARYRPKLAIIEIQELQRRYRDNARVQADAAALFALFLAAGYKVLYKDMINTVFVHDSVVCCGGD